MPDRPFDNAPKPKPPMPAQQPDPRQMHHGPHDEHGANPHMLTQETPNIQQGMTAKQIQQQIEAATQAKLQNKGVPQTARKMRMMTQQDPEFAQRQQAAKAAVSAAVQATTGEQLLQADSADNFSRVMSMVKPLDNSSFVQTVARPTPTFGMEDATGKTVRGKKTLSMGARQDKPIDASYKQTQVDVDKKREQTRRSDEPQSDVILGNASVDQSVQATPTSPTAVDKIKVFFVPTTCDAEKMTNEDFNYTHIAVGGQEQQVAVSKFRPVVYLKNEDAIGLKPVDIPGVKIKDGYTQVDANEYATSKGVFLKDVMDETGREQMIEHAASQKPRDYQIAVQKLSAGTHINDFATSMNDVSLNVPVVADGTNNYNVYDYNLSSIGDGHGATMIKTILNNIHNTSLENDRHMNPEIYGEIDAFDKRCLDKSDIIQQRLPKKERDAAFAKLDADYEHAQTQRYMNSGLDDESIAHMKALGYIGVDSTRFASHIAPTNNLSSYMQNITTNDSHRIVDGAGKFTINGGSEGTNFGEFLMQHKSDILDIVGNNLGVSDEASRNQKLHISTPSTSGNVSTCVMVYEGFDGCDMTQVDKAMRDAVKSILADYGDKHVQTSSKSYAVEQGELDICNTRYAHNTPQYAVLPYREDTKQPNVTPQPTPQMQNEPITLDNSLSAGFDAAQDYYNQMAQNECGLG